MPLPDLATSDDLDTYGYSQAGVPYLARASVRVRRYTGQQVTPGQSTITLSAGMTRLPEQPVTEIVSVNGLPSDLVAGPGGYLPISPCWVGTQTVVYSHGFDPVPDVLVELVCAMASRMASTPEGMASGVQTEQAGGESVTWGADAWSGTSGLTRGEKQALDRIFPMVPVTIWMRP